MSDEMSFEKSLEYIKEKTIFFHRIANDRDELYKEINNLEPTKIKMLSEGLEKNLGGSTTILRYVILKALEQKVEITDAFVNDVKDKFRSRDSIFFGKYVGKETIEKIESYKTNKGGNPFVNWSKPFSIFYVYFNDIETKGIVESCMKTISETFLTQIKLSDFDVKYSSFDGAQNYGQSHVGFCAYPKELKDYKNAIQLHCNIIDGNFVGGIYKGTNVKESPEISSVIQEKRYSTFDDLVHGLDALKESVIEINNIIVKTDYYVETKEPVVNGVTETGKERIPLNQILYGPPGTGKTYSTIDKTLEILTPENAHHSRTEKVKIFNQLKDNGQVQFITFHQSYSYEEFVEGLKPVIAENGKDVTYSVKSGIFKQVSTNASSESLTVQVQGDIDFKKANIFKMSLGNTLDRNDDDIFDNCISQGYISLGYGMDIDFSGADTKDKVKEIYDSKLERESVFTITAVDRFKNHMKIGDLVLISRGNTGIRAIGKITGEYVFSEKPEISYYQHRNVEWLYHGDEIPAEKFSSKNLSQQTIYQLKQQYLKMDFIKDFLSKKTQGQEKDYVLIIDEINRGEISKVFGELITLIEPDKRIGAENELRVTLPYSGDTFGVPKNLYIIGTMNTADRSIALLDIALRRRFDFIPMYPDSSVIENNSDLIEECNIDLRRLLDALNDRIEALRSKDYTIGHSYFMGINSSDILRERFNSRIIPLLEEYFYNDYELIAKVLNQGDNWNGEDVIIHKKEVFENYVKYSINADYSMDAIKRIYE